MRQTGEKGGARFQQVVYLTRQLVETTGQGRQLARSGLGHELRGRALAKDGRGKVSMTVVTLRPKVTFSGAQQPTPQALEQLHHEAHEKCYIANSLNCEVVVEAR